MIDINTENRMKEIAGNLKQDVKDLLNESANLVTGFFKQGLCSIRDAATRWKNFTRDISDAVGTLFRPSEDMLPPTPTQELDPDAEPVVTILESADEHFPVGLEMSLSQANELVGQIDQEYFDTKRAPQPVKVKIDYMKDGQSDSYRLPLQIGSGKGNMLEQMQKWVDSYRTSPEKVSRLFDSVSEPYRETLRTQFTPFLQSCFDELSTSVLHYFRRHCDISELERESELQAQTLPEKGRRGYLAGTKLAIITLRKAVNIGQQQPTAPKKAQEQTTAEQVQQPSVPVAVEQAGQENTQRPRRSVKLHLRQLKEGQPPAPKPQKGRAAPQR